MELLNRVRTSKVLSRVATNNGIWGLWLSDLARSSSKISGGRISHSAVAPQGMVKYKTPLLTGRETIHEIRAAAW